MNISFVIAALTAAVVSADEPSFNNRDYILKSAVEKQEQIWSAVTANTIPQDWYDATDMGGLMTESMVPTIATSGDEMPKSSLSATRKKYIHTQATVATVKLTQLGVHPFTGIFQAADHGVVRLSFAAQPNPTVLNTTPAMGLKFLRDGQDSANLVASNTPAGQPSWNFFYRDFSNHIPAAADPFLDALAAKFATATPWIQTVGLSDWAQYDQQGKTVESPVFPFSLRFHPSGEVEFSDSYDGIYFLDHLKTIQSGTTLYQVYGTDQPTQLGGIEYYIGDLITTSDMTTSNWGDNHLYFRHHDMGDDLKIHPEWDAYVFEYPTQDSQDSENSVGQQVKKGCPFAHMFQ